ncbi:MAG: Spy/CpxP family protein refolding chaperone [Candidatus Brocadiia bacterium]|jgi:Spy/CpxP family protein refolding chaperone
MNRESIVGCAVAALMFAGTFVGTAAWAADQAPPAPAGQTAEPAQHPLRRLFFGNLRQLGETFKGLNLTPDQKAQIGAILKSHKAEIVGALQALHAKHEALLDAVRAGAVNEAAIRAAAREMGDAIADASILRAKIRLEIRAVLTPDQCRQVDQALDQVSRSVTDALDGLANP